MCKWGSDIVGTLPDHVNLERERRTAPIDKCIFEPIQALWSAGVSTLGCCCGHGEESPSVVLSDGVTEIDKVREVLATADPECRTWVVQQWRLTEVAIVIPNSEGVSRE